MKTNEKALEEYYIWRKGDYLGNSPMWWAKQGKGYTAYILGAERFTEAEALELEKDSPEKYKAFKCSEIDRRLHLVFDAQDIPRLKSNEPCNWSGGYAKAHLSALQSPLPEVEDDLVPRYPDSIYKVGDMPPQGYNSWNEWASVQYHGGLRSTQCKMCLRWHYPQEVEGHHCDPKAAIASKKE